MMINCSKLPQVLDIPNKAFPATIYPGSVFDETIYKCILLDEYFKKFDSSFLSKYKNISLIRAYAMGDILQLIPVARYLKRVYNYTNTYIVTNNEFKVFGSIFKDIKFISECLLWGESFDFGLKVNLDGCLEKDHSLSNKENALHRIEIYFNSLGLKNIKKEDLDWSADLSEVQLPFTMDETKKYIGIQMRGSGEIKTLPKDYVHSLISVLSKDYTVVLMDHDKNQGFEGENILNLCGKISTIQCIAVLSKIKACVTMDSGMLWMAHVAKCPVVALLGPTRINERVSLHPLYPEKAKGIQITDLIGCQPCFETRKFCGGRIRCMKDFPRDKLTSEILKNIKMILGEN